MTSVVVVFTFTGSDPMSLPTSSSEWRFFFSDSCYIVQNLLNGTSSENSFGSYKRKHNFLLVLQKSPRTLATYNNKKAKVFIIHRPQSGPPAINKLGAMLINMSSLWHCTSRPHLYKLSCRCIRSHFNSPVISLYWMQHIFTMFTRETVLYDKIVPLCIGLWNKTSENFPAILVSNEKSLLKQ